MWRKENPFALLVRMHIGAATAKSSMEGPQILTVKVFIWSLYSVPLIYVSVFMTVPCGFDYSGLRV